MPPGDTHDLSNDQQAIAFYERRYQKGYLDAWPESKKARVEWLIRSLGLPSQGRALDFGCGNGIFTAVLGRALPDWSIVGTEISATALALARRRCPECTFVSPSDGQLSQAFDFVFSHHVLEHVSNLASTTDQISSYGRPTCSMLHILPCGNAGSFEHRVCSLRRDGIDTTFGNRFFHDDEGHLRRLRTEDMIALWADRGFHLSGCYYSNHWAGALKWLIEEHGPGFLAAFADPSRALDSRAGHRLRVIRAGLLSLWLARKPAVVVESKLRHGCHSARDLLLLAAGLPLYVPSKATIAILEFWAEREWQTRRENPSGTEMYLYFTRRASEVDTAL